MKTLCTIQVMDEQVEVKETVYARGGTALVLESACGEPFGTYSVYVPDIDLAESEFAVRTWCETAQLREPMLATGLFEDTGRRVPCALETAEIWRFKPTQEVAR